MYTILPLMELDAERQSLEKNPTQRHLVNKIIDLFTVTNRVNELPQYKKCISLTLFCQKVDNKVPTKVDATTFDEGGKWHSKYYKSLENFIQDFRKSDKYYAQYKIRIYLEKQLQERGYAQRLLQLCPDRIELFLMKHNSIGAQPGMLWRYLAFDDKSLDIVFASDIDVDFNEHVPRKLNLFENSKQSAFGRFLGWHNQNYPIKSDDPVSAENYAVCLGSSIAMRPKLFKHQLIPHITVKRTMVNYILHRIRRIQLSKAPWEEKDGYNTRRFNKPIGAHTYGWGNYWTMYGFDEKFFKHTLFPYFIERGRVQTWTSYGNLENMLPPNNPFVMDINYTRAFDNPIDYLQ
jgi:hypothetical protein